MSDTIRTPTRRGRYPLTFLSIVAAGILGVSLAGCGGVAQSSGGDDTAVDGGVEVDSLDELVEVAVSIGGPTVETEIAYVDGSETLLLGGLTIDWPFLAELDYVNDSGRNIAVPPGWPTLERHHLYSHADPFGNPAIGLATFVQSGVVTDDEGRARLIEAAMWQHQDSEVVVDAETGREDGSVTCWAHIRYGSVDRGFRRSYGAVVLFAGEGIAASGITFWAPSSYTEIPRVVGDLVESACGARPDGL